jgi:fructose-1,6-bisphosphatase II / sedoheptulose-1,7-bisphosphatase
MTSDNITVPQGQIIERILTLELVRVTERAAVAAARLRGHGNEKAADQAAVDAMRRELNRLPIDGTVVIGEGERDEAPMLFIGERVGNRAGPKVDIAVDPLEGTTLCAKDMPGSIAVMAMAEAGTLLAAPDVYMHKIAIGPGYAKGVVDLDASPEDNIHALAKAKGVKPSELTALILDRPATPSSSRPCADRARRAAHLGRRRRGRDLHLQPDETGIDIYLGIGAAPEGVLAAGALRCIGGPDAGPPHPRHRGEAHPRRRHGREGPEQEVRHDRARLRRRDRRAHGRHRRRAAQGRALRRPRSSRPRPSSTAPPPAPCAASTASTASSTSSTWGEGAHFPLPGEVTAVSSRNEARPIAGDLFCTTSAVTPHPALPHKGGGSTAALPAGATGSPPPCGEGLGVGVTAVSSKNEARPIGW